MDESARGERPPDADPMRALVLAMLDRIEQFATTVVSDRDGGPVAHGDRTSADIGPVIRQAVDQMIAEIGDIVTRLIAAAIAVLEAISAGLTEAVGERATRTATARPSHTTGFVPIAVEVETGEPQL
ncbi:hypothetical protein ACQ7HM_16640 [Williamsia sp. MIQD14]|uniref:hypothetical protein n=1 Tax=Williamsia sp. MIQD14 TaxID=3425703 RepID=UPI003DA00E7F